jgi:N-glycosylase/DNA lyase
MQAVFENGGVRISGACISHFDMTHIFECGQCFRFERIEGGYEGVALGGVIRVKKKGEDIFLYPCTLLDFEEKWRGYFDLDRDYACLFSMAERDGVLQEGLRCAAGLRILNQPPFETLISFILSANNNLARIRGIVRRMCARFGEPFCFEGRAYYDFPTPAALAGAKESDLLKAGAGYRAPYVKKTAQAVADGFDMEALRTADYEDAKRALMTLPGVGPKVADCVLLFSLGHSRAFPADVWIKRVLMQEYGFTGNDKQIQAFATEKYGEHAGIAQQYLFFWIKEREKA